MKIQLSNTDKVLSIVSSTVNIGGSIFAYFFKPEYFNIALIISITIITITLIIVLFRAYKYNRDFQYLSKTIDTQSKELEKQKERILLLEKLMNVPFFKKWNLIYTFLWRSNENRLRNNIRLSEVVITRTLSGNGRIKDNNIIYRFKGEFLGLSKVFKISIGGSDNNVSLKDISFSATDLRNKESLHAQIEYGGRDDIVKEVVVFFKENMNRGDFFELELQWKWPKTAFAKTDYFSYPNIYSLETKKILMNFHPTSDMNITKVEIWKFGLDDNEPQFIDYIYPLNNGYHFIIENPENTADYILYYE